MDRLGLAIVSLCHGTGAPLRRTQAPPGPFKNFWRVRYGEKFYYRCGPLPMPLVVMITVRSNFTLQVITGNHGHSYGYVIL